MTDMPEWDCVLWLESRGVLARGEISGRFGLTPEHLRAFESVARDGTKGEGDTAIDGDTAGDTSGSWRHRTEGPPVVYRTTTSTPTPTPTTPRAR